MLSITEGSSSVIKADENKSSMVIQVGDADLIIIYLTANGLSPSGSGYYAHT
jgi:hypothetical protein